MNRRTFLKMIAASAAPAFIPAGRLWLPPERATITVFKGIPSGKGNFWFFHQDAVWGVTGHGGGVQRIEEITGLRPIVSSQPWADVFLEGNARAVGLIGDWRHETFV